MNDWTRQLICDNNVRPKGFPPALWVLIRGTKTLVTDEEENEWVVLNTCALRKLDLTIESDPNGYVVTGIPQRVRDQIIADEKSNEVSRGERFMSTTVMRKTGSGVAEYNMRDIMKRDQEF